MKRLLFDLSILLVLATLAPAQHGGRWAAVCDSKGNLHAIECRQEDGNVLYRAWDGRQWSEPGIVCTGFSPFNPALAVDPQDNVHLVWSDAAGSMDNADVFHVVLSGGAWSQPEDLTQAAGWEWGASLAILPTGEIHVTWQSAQGMFEATAQSRGFRVSGAQPELWHRVCRDGEWALPEPIVRQSNTFGSLSVDSKGRLHMAYIAAQSFQGASISYSCYADGTWSPSERVGGIAGMVNPSPLQVVADASGELHLIYLPMGVGAPLRLAYCRKVGDEWQGPSPLGSQLLGPSSCALLAGPDGSVHLAYPERTDGPRNCLAYTRYADGKWSAPVPVLPDAPMEIALAADAEGNAHIIWGRPNRFGHVYSKGGQWLLGAQG